MQKIGFQGNRSYKSTVSYKKKKCAAFLNFKKIKPVGIEENNRK